MSTTIIFNRLKLASEIIRDVQSNLKKLQAVLLSLSSGYDLRKKIRLVDKRLSEIRHKDLIEGIVGCCPFCGRLLGVYTIDTLIEVSICMNRKCSNCRKTPEGLPVSEFH